MPRRGCEGRSSSIETCRAAATRERLRSDGFPQINHFGFHVEGFDALERRLRELGAGINYGGVVRSGGSRSVCVEDPSGYEIELSERLGGGLH